LRPDAREGEGDAGGRFFGTWAGQIYKGVIPILSDPVPTMSARLKEGVSEPDEAPASPSAAPAPLEARAA